MVTKLATTNSTTSTDISQGSCANQITSKSPATAHTSKKSNQAEDDPKKGIMDAITSSSFTKRINDCSPPLEDLVEEWIAKYDDNREDGLVELLKVFVSASGCQGVITLELFNSINTIELVERLGDQFNLETVEYPIIVHGSNWRKFRSNLGAFVKTLVNKCKYLIIYDQYLMRNVISFLAGLSDSKIRAFRHTATLFAIKIMTGVVESSRTLDADYSEIMRQIETAKSRVGTKKRLAKQKTLKEQQKKLEQHKTELTEIKNYILKKIFSQRYRDIVPDIRTICLCELGHWLITDPDFFLRDENLKYIGWSLYDRSGEVRLACLRVLQPMYESAEIRTSLQQFTSKFKERIVQMVYDKDCDVAVQATKTVIAIYRCDPEVVSLDECRNVFRLIYGSNRTVARAAGGFLWETINGRAVEEGILTKSDNVLSNAAQAIYDVISYYVESEYFNHAFCLVDALFESCPPITDWGTMTDLLLEEPVDPQYALCRQSESILVEMMVLSLKQSCNEGIYSRKLSPKENKRVELIRMSLSEHFITFLPKLCAKFIADEEITSNLLEVIPLLDISLFSRGEFTQRLDDLLKLLEEIIEKHVTSKVLENCSHAYTLFFSDTCGVSISIESSKNTVVGNLVEDFVGHYDSFIRDPSGETFGLECCLRKLFAFYCFHDLTAWSLSPYFSAILSVCLTKNVTSNVVVECLRAQFLAICWSLKSIKQSDSDDVVAEPREKGEISPGDNNTRKLRLERERIMPLKREIDEFISICECFLTCGPIMDKAFLLLVDTLSMLGGGLEEDESLLSLQTRPSESLKELMVQFMDDFVLVDGADDRCEVRRECLSRFCKLVIYGTLKFHYSIVVLGNYAKLFDVFGDIIKSFLLKLKEIDQVLAAKLIIATLIDVYDNIVDPSEVKQVRDLSKKLSQFYGAPSAKTRESVAIIHHKGIKFSLQKEAGEYPNISFFDVIADFSAKIFPRDRSTILGYLDSLLLHFNIDHNLAPSLGSYRQSLDATESLNSQSVETVNVSHPSKRQCSQQSIQSTFPSSLSRVERFESIDEVASIEIDSLADARSD